MNDASNIIITNNKSDLTYIKFNKMNNKAKSPVNISEVIQKINQSKSKNNNNHSNGKGNNKPKNINNNFSIRQKNNNDKNNQNNNEQINLNVSINFTGKNYFFLKLNRYFSTKVKIIILIIFLICSVVFLGINLYDYINYMKNYKYYIKKYWLINNFAIFLLQIFFSLGILFYQCIIFFTNQGENHNFIISSIIFMLIFTSIRIFIYVKYIKISVSILINLVYSLLIFFINIIFLMVLIIANKKKKNVLQNIDEIVYFTENNNPKPKKDINFNNNSPNDRILKKVTKPVQLVEDDNDIKNKNGCK